MPKSYSGAMGNPSQWDSKSINESFIYREQDAHLRLKECRMKAKSNPRYQWFADEAAAKASVYDYVDNKSFLASREELLSALRELRAMPAPKGEIFDRDKFVQCRLLEIDNLLREFAAASQPG